MSVFKKRILEIRKLEEKKTSVVNCLYYKIKVKIYVFNFHSFC